MLRHFLNVVGLFALVLTLTACPYTSNDSDRPAIIPSNVQLTQERAVSGFTRVVFAAFGQLTIQQGDAESLTIRTSDNLLPLIRTTISGDVLTIDVPDQVRFSGFPQATFTLTVRDVNALSLNGVGSILAQGLNSPNLNLSQEGAGTISVSGLTTDNLVVELNGTGDIAVAGTAQTQTATVSGAGNYLAGDLRSETVTVTLQGVGDVTVWATTALNANLSGVGTLNYWGSPTITEQKDGIGGLVALGNK
jgi:hypothetical protein